MPDENLDAGRKFKYYFRSTTDDFATAAANQAQKRPGEKLRVLIVFGVLIAW